MLSDRPLSIAARRRGLPPGSPPPARAATPISRMILVKILPRRASTAFLRASMEGPRPMAWRISCGNRGLYVLRPAAMLEAPVAQECGGLARGLRGQHQPGVAAVDQAVVAQPGQPGLGDADGAVGGAVHRGE